MAPAMLHVLSELSALASELDIKNAILANYSDISITTEAAIRLQNMQTSLHKPLVTFNHRYEAIHKVAFGLSPLNNERRNRVYEQNLLGMAKLINLFTVGKKWWRKTVS